MFADLLFVIMLEAAEIQMNIFRLISNSRSLIKSDIRIVFSQSSTQICVIHQIRNSCKYVAYKDKKEFTADMKGIYNAPIKRLLLRDLTIWKRNGMANILMPYFHGETINPHCATS